jgi:hypothetical protein
MHGQETQRFLVKIVEARRVAQAKHLPERHCLFRRPLVYGMFSIMCPIQPVCFASFRNESLVPARERYTAVCSLLLADAHLIGSTIASLCLRQRIATFLEFCMGRTRHPRFRRRSARHPRPPFSVPSAPSVTFRPTLSAALP